jgi:hypothetical protein
MRTLNEELVDTKRLLQLWKEEGEGKILVKLPIFSWRVNTPFTCSFICRLLTCDVERDRTSNTSTVTAGTERLAGMFLSAAAPKNRLIRNGLKAVALYEQLEEIFPTLTYATYADDKIRFFVDPLTREYLDKVKPAFPKWARDDWYFSNSMGFFTLTGFTPYCEGAFRWKTSKNS